MYDTPHDERAMEACPRKRVRRCVRDFESGAFAEVRSIASVSCGDAHSSLPNQERVLHKRPRDCASEEDCVSASTCARSVSRTLSARSRIESQKRKKGRQQAFELGMGDQVAELQASFDGVGEGAWFEAWPCEAYRDASSEDPKASGERGISRLDRTRLSGFAVRDFAHFPKALVGTR